MFWIDLDVNQPGPCRRLLDNYIINVVRLSTWTINEIQFKPLKDEQSTVLAIYAVWSKNGYRLPDWILCETIALLCSISSQKIGIEAIYWFWWSAVSGESLDSYLLYFINITTLNITTIRNLIVCHKQLVVFVRSRPLLFLSEAANYA